MSWPLLYVAVKIRGGPRVHLHRCSGSPCSIQTNAPVVEWETLLQEQSFLAFPILTPCKHTITDYLLDNWRRLGGPADYKVCVVFNHFVILVLVEVNQGVIQVAYTAHFTVLANPAGGDPLF